MIKYIYIILLTTTLSYSADAQIPTILKDIRLNGGSMEETSTFTPVGKNKMMFFAKDDSHGTEPWITDGTTAGTMLLADLDGSSAPSFPFDYSTAVDEITGKTYFTAYNEGTNLGIYVTDGTNNGTKLFYQPNSFPYNLQFFGGKLYYTNKDYGLSTTDGTDTGTKDVIPQNLKVYPLAVIGNKVYYSVNDPNGGGIFGTWSMYSLSLNGTATKEAFKTNSTSDEVLCIYEGKAGLYIGAGINQSADIYLYSPSTGKTTKILSAIGDYIRNFTTFKGKDYFLLNNRFYESDGTPIGTKVLKTFTHSTFTWTQERFAKTDDFLFMSGETSVEGDELWTYNPTTGMTNIDIVEGTESSMPNEMVSVGNKIYFTANTTNKGNELMVSDGTKAGTKMLADLNTGSNSSFPTGLRLAKLGTKTYLFFVATDTEKDREPFMMQVEIVSATENIGNLENNFVSLSPNPAMDKVAITFKEQIVASAWDLHDLQGRNLAHGKLSSNPIVKFDVSLPSDLTSGIYIFVITDSQGKRVAKKLLVH